MSTSFGIQGPLIPGDASFSSGMVNGSVRVFGTVQSDVSKTELTVLATGLTALTGVTATTTAVLNGMLDGVINVSTMATGAVGSFVLPSATAVLAGLAAQSFLNTVGSPLAQYPSVGDVFQFDVINTTGAGLAVFPSADGSMSVLTPTTTATATADTVKYMFTNLSTPAAVVYTV